MSSPRKPSAADRTISFLDGKTQAEKGAEAERIRQNQDLEDNRPREPVTMEQSVDKWRDKAFQVQEWSTELFGKSEAKDNQYRITNKNGYIYLEGTGNNKSGAFSYKGFMFPEEDIPKLAHVIVAAAREYLKRTKAGSDGSKG